VKPSHDWKGRLPNFTDEFTEYIAKQFDDIPSPEAIFYYIYGILCSTYYRTKFNDLLRIDFPKIPFITDKGKFLKISNLGQKLADLQLKHTTPTSGVVRYLGKGTDSKVEFVERRKDEIWTNSTKHFDGITDEVWDYIIGNYPVLSKWLKYRVGRDLAYTEVQEFLSIAAIISDTIDLVNSVDSLTAGEF